MHKYLLTTIRQDSSIEWYTKDLTTETYIQETYYDTGIMTVVVNTEDSSEFVLVKEITFLDTEQFYIFTTDPIVVAYIALRKTYEKEHGIIRFKESIT